MNNSYKFFENKECEYYPCHKGMTSINCLFCYCPFYSWEECPGKNEYIKKSDGRQIKDCSSCNFPHDISNRDKIIEYLKMGYAGYKTLKHPIDKKFYGIGVGPGDAKLLTIKALDIIKTVDVLILPAKDKESCRAYTIIKKVFPNVESKECMFLPFPMSMKEPELSSFHRDVALTVESAIDKGKSVGFLSIGDVSIYSTYAYVEQLVAEDGYETEYVSGIPSFVAASARLNTYLTLGNEEMHIIPGSADIGKALELSGTLVFMKSGKRLAELKSKLIEIEDSDNYEVMAVSNCGMDNEIVTIGAENITEENGYLTVVIVKRK